MATQTFLHISDLHFGAGRTGSAFFEQARAVQGILDDVLRMRAQLRKPDWIVISGDIAWKGSEFLFADGPKQWMQELLQRLEVDPARVLMVPGNHDVDRSRVLRTSLLAHKALRQAIQGGNPGVLDDYLLEQPDAIADFKATLWPKLEAYADFARAYPSSAITPERPFWVKVLVEGAAPLYAVGLNSSLLSFDSHDGPQTLLLGRGQLFRAFRNIPANALVLVVVHHPLDGLVDGRREVLSYIGKRPYMLLSGHVHEQAATVRTGFGSGYELVAGAAYGHEGGQHRYAWFQLSAEGVVLYPRIWVPSRGEFRADGNQFDLDDKGRHILLEPGIQSWAASASEPARPFDVQPQDRLLLINYQGALPAPQGFNTWEELGTSDVIRVEGTNPNLPQRLRASPVDGNAWREVVSQLRDAVQKAVQGLSGRLHLFVAAPHAAGAFVGRLLEEYGRFIEVRVYQFQFQKKSWALFGGESTQTSSGPGYFADEELLYARGDRAQELSLSGVVLAFEVIQPMPDDQLIQVVRRVGAREVMRLKPRGERVIQPSQERQVLEQCFQSLERLRQIFPGEPLYLATSGPLALVMELARRLRQTVYSSVIMLHFEAKGGNTSAVSAGSELAGQKREERLPGAHSMQPPGGASPFYYPVLDIISGKVDEAPPLVYVEKVLLRQVRRFGPCELPLVAPGFNVLAGPNGAGKTTFLQALAIVMMQKSALESLNHDYPVTSFIQNGASRAEIELFLASMPVRTPQTAEHLAEDSSERVTSTLKMEEIVGELSITKQVSGHRAAARAQHLRYLAFGATRRMGTRDMSEAAETLLKKSPERYRFLSLFRGDVTQDGAYNWWKETFLLQPNEELKSFRKKLLALLNDDLFPDGWGPLNDMLEFERAGRSLALIQMSDGVRAVLALVLDILRQLYWDHEGPFQVKERTSEVEAPKPRWETPHPARVWIELPMIVLIDELDMHLHPSFQKKLGFWLCSHFTGTQFIVTTHSPFIAQAASEGGLIRLPGLQEEDSAPTILTGDDHLKVVNGTADDAAVTLFGLEHIHSERSELIQAEVTELELELRSLDKQSTSLRAEDIHQQLQALKHKKAKLEQQLPQDQKMDLTLLLRRVTEKLGGAP